VWKIQLPSALPYVLTGIRLGVGRALLGVVIAELVAGSSGLGFLLKDYGETYDTAKLLVSVSILAAMGWGSFTAIRRVEGILAPWRETPQW
jgi:NitT/TauT family transport system permease protein